MSELKQVEFKKQSPWRIKRYYMYAFATIVSLVVPWITVNGNHFFLLSFDKMQLHLLFVQFDMQELYLMPFLLIILFIGIFGITVLGGRVFCGWLCPQTIFRVVYRDFIETKLLKLRKSIKNKQKEPDMSKPENRVKKTIAITIWSILSLIAASDLMWYFVPPEDFFKYMSNPSEHLILVGFVLGITIFLIYDIVFLQENFCIYVCPYSRVQSVLYDEHTIMAIYDEHRGGKIYDDEHHKLVKSQKEVKALNGEDALCTACESCVTVCPTHIDIRKGLQLECINCLECVDACTNVMAKFNEPSLVKWSSEYETALRKGKTQFFRPKIIGYGIVLGAVIAGLIFMATKKEHILLNINKDNRDYYIHVVVLDVKLVYYIHVLVLDVKLAYYIHVLVLVVKLDYYIHVVPRGCDLKTDNKCKIRVDNAYIFLLQNIQKKKMKYYFDVKPDIKVNGKLFVKTPSEPFEVKPRVKNKDILVISTYDKLVTNPDNDTIIPITIHAYALDKDGNPDKKISIVRKARFVFPREDLLPSK